jgi:hypothetical protein
MVKEVLRQSHAVKSWTTRGGTKSIDVTTSEPVTLDANTEKLLGELAFASRLGIIVGYEEDLTAYAFPSF